MCGLCSLCCMYFGSIWRQLAHCTSYIEHRTHPSSQIQIIHIIIINMPNKILCVCVLWIVESIGMEWMSMSMSEHWTVNNTQRWHIENLNLIYATRKDSCQYTHYTWKWGNYRNIIWIYCKWITVEETKRHEKCGRVRRMSRYLNFEFNFIVYNVDIYNKWFWKCLSGLMNFAWKIGNWKYFTE